MKKFWNAATGIGVLDSFSPKKEREYRLANTYTIWAILLLVLNAVTFAFFGLNEGAITCLIGIGGLSSSLVFAHFQKIKLGEFIGLFFNGFSVVSAVVFYGQH